jgi:hypothetical protein
MAGISQECCDRRLKVTVTGIPQEHGSRIQQEPGGGQEGEGDRGGAGDRQTDQPADHAGQTTDGPQVRHTSQNTFINVLWVS